MRIVYSKKFAREYKKLPEQLKILAEQKEKIFRGNPFNPRLKTHKLTGRLREFWAFSIDYQYRIIFSAGGGSAFGGSCGGLCGHSCV